jgi:O-6-methylguanine DNA methyltransferase
VLEAAAGVPFGEVTSYAGIAATIGKPSATRAVGNALGRNPVPIVVPCHRVVRSDWSLGGYTGGLPIKEHLLALEGAHLPLGGPL